MSTYSQFILGCQQNHHDADHIGRALEGLGYSAGDEASASVMVVLACSVRQHAVDRIHGKLHEWKKRLETPKIILTGCVLPADRKVFAPQVDLIIDGEDISEASLEPTIPRVGRRQLRRPTHQSSATGYVPITLGCNFFCTYCAVPFTRGAERSRDLADILADAKELIAAGAKEIMLLGQTVNSYGRDRRHPQKDVSGRPHANEVSQIPDPNFPTFAELLIALNNLPGDFQIAFLSPYPTEFTDQSIEAIASLSKVKKTIHLPLQAGDDTVLRRMNRRYTRAEYTAVAEKLLTRIPGCQLTTDIIVGFPGETEAQFEQSVNLARQIPFRFAYISQYSPRSGTVSAKFFKDDVPRAEKKRRWQILDELINQPTLRERTEQVRAVGAVV